jgi:xylulokinase
MSCHDKNVRFVSTPRGNSCTVGVDIGTTSVKAVAVNGAGEVVARARVPHKVVTPAAEMLEHDPARAWVRGPRRAFAEVSEALDGPAAGVVVTSMVPSITAVDKRGKPLLPGILYGDIRARRPEPVGGAEADPSDLGGEREQGRRMFQWAVEQQPGAFGYWNCQAVATHALAGVAAVDAAAATSFGSLMKRGRWNVEALAELGLVEEQVPIVGQMGGSLGTLPGTETAFAGGSVDAFCEQLVAGAHSVGDVLVIFGATLIVWIVTDEWKDVPGMTTLPMMIPGQSMIGGPSNAGALFVDWAKSLVGRKPHRAKSLAPGTDPVLDERIGDPAKVPVWLPYPRGERTPFHDPSLRASIHDMDISQGPDAVLRGAYEASGFVIKRMLEQSGFQGRRIIATGGGSRSVPWMQGVADATGLPVETVGVPEGGALGAAFLARLASGLETSFDVASSWARIGRRIEPDSSWVKAASLRYERFEEESPKG